jgi:hypothetical protein
MGEQDRPRDDLSDALNAFFLEHRLCCVLESATDDERDIISLTCRRYGAWVVLPLA